MKLTLKNIWVVPMRLLILGPFVLLAIVGQWAEAGGGIISNHMPNVEWERR